MEYNEVTSLCNTTYYYIRYCHHDYHHYTN